MKKEYKEASAVLVVISDEDILTVSGEDTEIADIENELPWD